MSAIEDTSQFADRPDGENGQQRLIFASSLNWRLVLLLAGLALAAYSPAFNNHFISDDYVIMETLNTGGLSGTFENPCYEVRTCRADPPSPES